MTSLRRKPKIFTYPSMCKESMKLPCDMKLHVDIFTIGRNLLQINPENPASNWQVFESPRFWMATRGNSSPWHLSRHLHCFQWSWAELSWAELSNGAELSWLWAYLSKTNYVLKTGETIKWKIAEFKGTITHLHVETWSFSSKVFQVSLLWQLWTLVKDISQVSLQVTTHLQVTLCWQTQSHVAVIVLKPPSDPILCYIPEPVLQSQQDSFC